MKFARRWLLPVGAMFALAACGVALLSVPTQPVTAVPYPTLDAAQVARGEQVYAQQCQRCHGANLQGAPNWATPGPDGLTLAPAHDDSGHTWHHPDRVLHEAIHNGMNDPLKPGSPLRMPAFGNALPDADIRAVVEFFKNHWSPEHRQYQFDETRKELARKPTPTPAP